MCDDKTNIHNQSINQSINQTTRKTEGYLSIRRSTISCAGGLKHPLGKIVLLGNLKAVGPR